MRPLLQLALDVDEVGKALEALQECADQIEVIECGTILILHEGLHAVRRIRERYPKHTILADVRIAEAGKLIAAACYRAGADWVSCVAGASLTTIEQVCQVAQEMGGQVQVELAEEHYSFEKAKRWRAAGVEHVIVKRSRDSEASGVLSWGENDFDRIKELAELGFRVTITGGIKPADLAAFKNLPVSIVIAGRAIVNAPEPRVAAAELVRALGEIG